MAKMLTSRQIIVLIIALVESFILSAHYAVFMPFYPNVAKDKGNTPSEIGAFFAVGSFVGLVGAPVAGWFLKQGVSPKKMVIFGLLLSGVFLTVHGLHINLFSKSSDFFYANAVTRVIHAIGPLAATTAIYPIVAVEMDDQKGVYIPLLEAAYNMGLMIWPSIGAIMFDNFGYMFPFFSVGLCAIIMGLIVAVLMPSPKNTTDDEEQIGFDKIDCTLLLILTNIGVCYLTIGFNDITLSTELKAAFDLTHTQVGYCFAVSTICYGVCIYLWGLAVANPKGRCISQGTCYVLSMVGLFLMEPCQFIGFEPTLLVRLAGQAAMGIGLAGLFTASLVSGMAYLTEELLLPDNVATHGFFSGLIFFSLCGGYLIGQGVFAGVIIDMVGYNSAVIFITGTIGFVFIIDVLFKIGRCCTRSRRLNYKRIGSDSKDTERHTVHNT